MVKLTRSVRRTSGFVQVGIPDKWISIDQAIFQSTVSRLCVPSENGTKGDR